MRFFSACTVAGTLVFTMCRALDTMVPQLPRQPPVLSRATIDVGDGSANTFSINDSSFVDQRHVIEVAEEGVRMAENVLSPPGLEHASLPSVWPTNALPLPEWEEEFHSSSYHFSTYANWLVKGVLMVGRYPGVEPARCTNASCAEDHLALLVSAGGIVTWVSFQHETPPQNLAMPATTDTALVKSTTATKPSQEKVGSRNNEDAKMSPSSEQQPLDASPEHGAPVRGNSQSQDDLSAPSPPQPWTRVTTEEWRPGVPNAFLEGGRSGDFGAYAPTVARLAYHLERPPPRFVHFPIVDLTAPSLEDLCTMVDTIVKILMRHSVDSQAAAATAAKKDRLDSGDKHHLAPPEREAVYLHCWGGKGRSGTVAAAVLATLYPHLSEEQVLGRLKEAFKTRGLPGDTPETDDQRQVLSQFFAERNKKRSDLQQSQPQQLQ